VKVAWRYSRAAHELEDLAHDVIVSALRRGSARDGEPGATRPESSSRFAQKAHHHCGDAARVS
jgi:DNA-directed RNA polymerase specialized sigma24 family protein